MERRVNYIYFGLLFVILSFLHVYQIFLIENGSFLHRFFYIVHAIGQCFLEVGALGLLGDFLVKKYPKSLNPVFILLTFVWFMIHIIDFPLVRIMDLSIWYGLDLISSESFENFIEMLYACHISMKAWMIAGVVLALMPILGIVFFFLTNAIAKRRPLNFSQASAGLSLFAIVLFLSLFDFRTGKLASPQEEEAYLKALPWKTTIFPSTYPSISLDRSLKAPCQENEVLKELASVSCNPERKPNIILFIVESLRDDFITQEVAPSFSRFREENLSLDLAFSSANFTQGSWFSIFHSIYPFYWGKMKTGSLPLRILKKAGYKIHVYTSSGMGYYSMDDVIFGPGHAMADDFHFFASHDGTIPSYESDGKCFAKLQEDFEEFGKEQGHLFIVFLEATHFDYSWPKRGTLQFTPIEDSIDYFKVTYSNENIEGIKNRYRNAIFYLDTLFGEFYQKLKKTTWGEDAVVVLTGDHGEEFFEEGHLFHASNLNSMQTRVPIYYRFGENSSWKDAKQNKITAHVDIFPSILHYVFGEDIFGKYFDGESIFIPKTRPFILSARYNASRAPQEFFIHNGKHKIMARFVNGRDIFKSPGVQVLSKKDLEDKNVSFELEEVEQEFACALKYLFP